MVANKLLEHFLLYFTALGGQRVRVVDEVHHADLSVNDVYEETFETRHTQDVIAVNGKEFTVHHLLIKQSTDPNNVVNLCAAGRVISSMPATDVVPEVSRKNRVTVEGLRYHGYVTGDYLDDIADDGRAHLRFPPEGDEEAALFGPIPNEVKRSELMAAVAECVRAKLSGHIGEVRASKEKRLDDFVAGSQPQYRPFLEAAKRGLDRLPEKPGDDDIEIVLHHAKMAGRDEMKKLVEKIVRDQPSHAQVDEATARLVARFAAEANRHSVSALAEAVWRKRSALAGP